MSDPNEKAIQRSLAIYRGDAERDRALDAFYATFLRPGDLAFDIGAHVGDRTACFARLGARVVAVEPQEDCVALLRREFESQSCVRIVHAAIGGRTGVARLHRNEANPSVSTLSEEFIAAARGAAGWENQRWGAPQDVRTLTLDDLIEAHGVPHFIKIDIEGFEHEALKGLSRPVPALSFEFTTIQRDIALACVQRLHSLGFRAFRGSLGETLAYAQAQALDARTVADWLTQLPASANSGDIYAWHDA